MQQLIELFHYMLSGGSSGGDKIHRDSGPRAANDMTLPILWFAVHVRLCQYLEVYIYKKETKWSVNWYMARPETEIDQLSSELGLILSTIILASSQKTDTAIG